MIENKTNNKIIPYYDFTARYQINQKLVDACAMPQRPIVEERLENSLITKHCRIYSAREILFLVWLQCIAENIPPNLTGCFAMIECFL